LFSVLIYVWAVELKNVFSIFAGTDRKRENVGGPLPSIPSKKAKVGTTSILGRAGGSVGSGGAEAWEMVAVECEPAELVPAVLEACNLDEGDKEVICTFSRRTW
jgi:hypothetical protein